MSFPFKIVDLSHTLTPSMPTWNGSCGFNYDIKLDYEGCLTSVKFRVQQLKLHAGIGTHIDAPAHCVPGGISVADLDLNTLIAPCVVIDISDRAHADYILSPADIELFESAHGAIPPECFVIIHTGWERFWDDSKQYRNDMRFPSISKEAAEILMARNIVGVGIDTLSPDLPTSNYPVHQLLLGSGKYIIENIKGANQLPPTGSYTFALPIKVQEGAEAPIRLVGLICKQILL
jgi:kynurenine formamidase